MGLNAPAEWDGREGGHVFSILWILEVIKLAYLEPQEMYALKGIKYKYLQAFLLIE